METPAALRRIWSPSRADRPYVRAGGYLLFAAALVVAVGLISETAFIAIIGLVLVLVGLFLAFARRSPDGTLAL